MELEGLNVGRVGAWGQASSFFANFKWFLYERKHASVRSTFVCLWYQGPPFRPVADTSLIQAINIDLMVVFWQHIILHVMVTAICLLHHIKWINNGKPSIKVSNPQIVQFCLITKVETDATTSSTAKTNPIVKFRYQAENVPKLKTS